MKRILHLFRKEKFTEAFIELAKSLKGEHVFWVWGGDDYLSDQVEYLKSVNVKYYPRIDIKLNKRSTESELQEYDIIFYHGVFDDLIIRYFYIHKKSLRKLVLYFWGGDKEFINEWSKEKKYIVKNCAAIATIIPQDYWDLKKHCKPCRKYYCARYYNENLTFDINNISDKYKKDNTVINVQVGNSATITNNHLSILKSLSKFKMDNIKVYVPLSYGDMDYAEEVIMYGKNVLGDKFIPVKQFMPFDEYCKFNKKMDVGIFGMKRQQAMGNIIALIMAGCKIYFDTESLLWDFFSNDVACNVSDIGQIGRMNVREFAEFSEKDRLSNRRRVLEKFSIEESIRDWNRIIDSF